MNKFDHFYMNVAKDAAKMSHAKRLKVGAVAVSGTNILAYGYNGTPSGDDNCCEYRDYDVSKHPTHEHISDQDGRPYVLVTKDNVIHAEENVICKLASGTGNGVGATMYVTHAPCVKCARMMQSVGFTRLVYNELYRSRDGLDLLSDHGIVVNWMK